MPQDRSSSFRLQNKFAVDIETKCSDDPGSQFRTMSQMESSFTYKQSKSKLKNPGMSGMRERVSSLVPIYVGKEDLMQTQRERAASSLAILNDSEENLFSANKDRFI